MSDTAASTQEANMMEEALVPNPTDSHQERPSASETVTADLNPPPVHRDAGPPSLPQLQSVIDSLTQEDPSLPPALQPQHPLQVHPSSGPPPQAPPLVFYTQNPPQSQPPPLSDSHNLHMMAVESSRQLDVKDALSYLDAVKDKFQDRPDVYNLFLDIMKDFKSQSIDTPGVINRVSVLFHGHLELIQGFNTFLPPGYRIECSTNALEPGLITVTTPSGTITQTTNEGFQDMRPAFLASPSPGPRLSVLQPVLAPTPMAMHQDHLPQLVDRRLTPQNIGPLGHPSTSPHPYGPAVPMLMPSTAKEVSDKGPSGSDEFNHAIQFVNKIKTRYENDPETYKRFLEILHTYKKEQSDDDSQVYSQVQTLFRDAPDLLAEFKDFLPSAGPAGSYSRMLASGYGSNNADLWSILDATPDSDKRTIKSDLANTSAGTPVVTKRKKRAVEKDVMGHQPAVPSTLAGPRGGTGRSKKLKQAHKPEPPSPGLAPYPSRPNSPVQEQGRMPTHMHGAWPAQNQMQSQPGLPSHVAGPSMPPQSPGDELAFFDRAKRSLEIRDAYDEFLKLLDMFSKEIINLKTLIQRVTVVLADPELIAQFKLLLGWDDKKESGESGPPGAIRSRFPPQHSGPERVEKHGPSYRRLPMAEQLLATSGRDELCRSVLNDVWVSHPTWASEDSSFQSHKKNSYEEALHKSEEERHEYQFYIDITTRTISLLQPIHDRILDMSPEERNSFRLPVDFGGSSKSIYHRSIKKVYGRDAAGMEVLQALQESPAIAVPVILARLKLKNEEWRKAQREWNRVWREVDARNFYKSLDHQGITFKANDKKYITTKNFVGEIETAKNSLEHAHATKLETEHGIKTELSGKPVQTALHHIEYHFDDLTVLQDAMKLVFSYLDRSTVQYTAQERRTVEKTLRSFVLQLCMLTPEFDAVLGTPLESMVDPDETNSDEVPADNLSMNGDDEGIQTPQKGSQKGVSAGDLRRRLLKTSQEQNSNSRSGSRSRSGAASPNRETGATASPGRCVDNSASKSPPEQSLNDSWIKLMPMDVTTALSAPESDEDLRLVKDGLTDHRPFFANTTFYILLRLLQLLYSRLLTCKITAQNLAKQDPNFSVFFINPVAEELGLADSSGPGAVLAFRVIAGKHQAGQKKRRRDREMSIDQQSTDHKIDEAESAKMQDRPENHFYSYLLDACEKLFEGDMDQSTFEENMRYLFGTKAYFLFTLDKLIQSLIKQVQSTSTDHKCQELLSLHQKYLSRPKQQYTVRDIMRYRHEAEEYLNPDDHLYSIEWMSEAHALRIRLMNSATPDPSVLPPASASTDSSRLRLAQWRTYVDSYVLRYPTEVAGLQHRLRRTYLCRNKEVVADNASASENESGRSKRVVHYGQEIGVRMDTYKVVYKHNTEDIVWRRWTEKEETQLNARAAMRLQDQKSSHWLKL